MTDRPEWPKGRALAPTDREVMLAMQEADQAAVNAMQQIEHWRAQGIGVAAFALSMWQGLEGSGLTREEKVGLITAALRGR